MARAKGPAGANGAEQAALFFGVLAVVVFGAWIPLQVANPPGYDGAGPAGAVVGLATGKVTWTTWCTVVLVGELVTAAVLLVGGLWAWRRWGRRRPKVDAKARKLATGRDVAHMAPAAVAESARRLRPGTSTFTPDDTGIAICETVVRRMLLRQDWESMALDIWGPRRGKTTSRAIPAILAAPGPVLSTSNKADVVDATREPRAARGNVWVFDPQRVTGRDGQQCWWNPLRGITTVTQARELAEHFGSAERDAGTKRDPLFDPAAEALIGNFILAAALAGRPLLDIYRWSTAELDDTPARLLEQHGAEMAAEDLRGVMNQPEKMRGSIYGTAKEMLRCLTEPSVTKWVTEQHGVKEFDPAAFVRSKDTLYLLSKGGPGSPAPLIAALVYATLTAAEHASDTMPGHRLDPPLLAVLDEAANICRIRRLPALYSHYGSRGILIMTILQSYAQGVGVWGQDGMEALFSATTILVYGGGVKDTTWLKKLSDLIGPHDVPVRSVTNSSRSGRSTSTQLRSEPIFQVSELAALAFGRVIVVPTGTRPVLGRTCPWQTSPHAESVRASLAKWDPLGQHYDPTLQPVPDDDVTKDVQ